MPYRLEWELPWGVCVRFYGNVTPDDLSHLNHEVTASPQWYDLRYGISDFTGARWAGFDYSDIDSYLLPHAELMGALYSNRRFTPAIVTPTEALEKPFRKAMAAGAYPSNTGFFRTEAEARDWLAAQTMSYIQATKRADRA